MNASKGKLAYIHNMRFPTEKAHGYQIAKMCEAFAEAGLQVELLVPHRKNTIQLSAYDYYSTKRNFGIIEIPVVDALSRNWPRKMAFWLNSITFFWRCLRLRLDPSTLIYTRTPEMAWLFSFRGYTTVFECHQLPVGWRWLFAALIKKANLIVTITQGLKNELAKDFRIDENRIFVAPDGVDLDVFDIDVTQEDARSRLTLQNEKKIVVYTGQLIDWKGIDTLAQASESLDTDAAVYFVGGTNQDIAKFRAKYPNGRFKNIPNVSRETVALWLKAADVLVMPNSSKYTISARYTSPLKLFEYMASGTPIVASDLPSIREILDDSIATWAKPDDPASLSDAIKKVLNEREKSLTMSAKALAKSRTYSWTNRADQILKALNCF